MYISAVIDNQEFPSVPPNRNLRAELEKLSVGELFAKLEQVNPERCKNIDKHNKVRLIRALEVASTLKSIPPLRPAGTSPYKGEDFSVLIIGLNLPKEELVSRIEKRIDDRIPALFDEIKKLLSEGISPERLNSFGLEYRYGLEYVEGKINLDDFKKTLATKTWQYVRRQMTWWKRDSRVIWMNPLTDSQKILNLVTEFLDA
jgi:tRNA dimethylallyltransferase